MTTTWRLTSRSKNLLSAARCSFLVGTARSSSWRYSPTWPGVDVEQLELVMLAPAQELSDGVHVVLAGVGVGDLALEEFVPGELSAGASVADDRGRCSSNGRKSRPAQGGKLDRRVLQHGHGSSPW